MYVCNVLVGKPQRKIPLGRCRCGQKDNIKMDHREIRCEYMKLIQQDPVVCLF
jgi:hypothetical protein